MLRSANVLLRVATLGARFGVVLILARWLSPADVGQYGLLSASIQYLLYVVGMDFYLHTTRQMANSRERWGWLVKQHSAVVLGMYLLLAPIGIGIVILGVVDPKVLAWPAALLLGEHLCQEFERLLIAAGRPNAAGIALFLRAGGWPLIVAGLFMIEPGMRSLTTVFASWLGCLCVSVLVSLALLLRCGLGGWTMPIDGAWIRRGLRVAIPLLVGTLALRSISVIDRFLAAASWGASGVGAYVLFVSLSFALSGLISAGVHSYSYPRLVSAVARADVLAFRREFRRMAVLTVAFCAAYATGALVAVPTLVSHLDPTYEKFLGYFPIILASSVVFNLGFIPHWKLYATQRDTSIILSQVGGAAVFVGAFFFIAAHDAMLAVPVSTLLAYSFVLISKTVAGRSATGVAV